MAACSTRSAMTKLFVLLTLAAFGCTKAEVKAATDMAMPKLLEIPKTELYADKMDYPGIPPCHDNDVNNSFPLAAEAQSGSTYQFEICPLGNQDYYHFTVEAGSCAEVYVGYAISYGDLDL